MDRQALGPWRFPFGRPPPASRKGCPGKKSGGCTTGARPPGGRRRCACQRRARDGRKNARIDRRPAAGAGVETVLKHDPEKWKPVFGKDHASAKSSLMPRAVAGPEIERLIQLLARLPGLGPRSARRAALHLVKRREELMEPLAAAIADAHAKIEICSTCGNVDTRDPCTVCADE